MRFVWKQFSIAIECYNIYTLQLALYKERASINNERDNYK